MHLGIGLSITRRPTSGGAAVPGVLSGAIMGLSALAATMAITRPLTGAIVGTSAISAAVSLTAPLVGAITGTSAVAGTLTNTGAYSTEATAYFAAMSVQPDATRKGLIDTLITGLKTDGVWTGFDMFKIEAAHDAQAARLNAVAPASNVSTLSNSPTFTTDRGYAGDGSTSYVNLNWVPSAGVQHTLNSASIGVYVNGGSNTAADSSTVGAFNGATTATVISPKGSAGFIRGRVNGASSAVLTGATASTRLGLTVLNRSGSATVEGYRNGTLDGTQTLSSVSLPSYSLYQGAYDDTNVAAGFCNDRVATVFSGRSFNSTEQAAISSRIITFLTAIGAN